MAYTKAPVNDTHNTVRIPTLGSSIMVSSGTITDPLPITSGYTDCFPAKQKQWGTDPTHVIEKREAWWSDPNAVAVDVATGANSSPLIGRSIVIGETENSVYCVRNTSIYRLSNIVGFGVPSSTLITAAVNGPTSTAGTMAVDNTNTRKICFLDDVSQLYTFNENGSGLVTTNIVATLCTGYRNLVFLNGYLFAANNEGKIFNSSPGGVLTTWTTTNFLIPEIAPDPVNYLETHKNYLVAFGAQSIEFFYDNAIEVGSPLARQESYTSKVGIYHTSFVGKVTAKINDDIYFIGRNTSNSLSLYQIKEFKVSEIDSSFFQGALNWRGTIDGIPSSTVDIWGIERIIINNNPMILISLNTGQHIVYYPDEDAWWTMSNNDQVSPTPLNTDFPGFNKRFGHVFYPPLQARAQPVVLAIKLTGSALVDIKTPDWSGVTSSSCLMYTEVIDFGINFYKHIAQVDAIGDYGNNTVTLSFNKTVNYGQPYTTCTPTRTPSVNGQFYPLSWYNLGAIHRMSFKQLIAGAGPSLHEGLEVTYNVGTS